MPPVAKVLLIDGSMLRFTRPVKVIRLLLDHPHHFVCPLHSLQPGHHSLSTLLPDEELQLGHLYLLLPFHTLAHGRSTSFNTNMERTYPPLAQTSFSQAAACRSADLPDAASAKRSRLVARSNSDLCFSASEIKKRSPSPHNVSYSNSVTEKISDSSVPGSRLCDTPELQRAYRSVMLRRCRTWTPRLQAIKEGKRGASKEA